jgi:MFS family permease
MALSGRISAILDRQISNTNLPDLSLLTSLLSIVVGVAFFAGIAYACVAIPSQTQLQEDLPEDVRGRVFGVLNMLVSVASFLPILIVGPIADLFGTTVVLVGVAGLIAASGIASIYLRGPLRLVERGARASVGNRRDPFVEALGAEVAGPQDFLDARGRRLADIAPDEAQRIGRGHAAAGRAPDDDEVGATDLEVDPDLDPGRARRREQPRGIDRPSAG